MAINYSVSKRPNPKEIGTHKWYANAQVTSNYTFGNLCAEVEKMCTVTEGDVLAVISSAISCMINALRRGESVYLGDLGSFRVGLSSVGTDTPEEFTSANISKARITFLSGKALRNAAKSFQYKRVEPRPQKNDSEQTGNQGEQPGV